jgi:hypothetical protein
MEFKTLPLFTQKHAICSDGSGAIDAEELTTTMVRHFKISLTQAQVEGDMACIYCRQAVVSQS